MTAGAFARKCPPIRERRRGRGHHGLFLFAFCCLHSVCVSLLRTVPRRECKQCWADGPLMASHWPLVGRDENANRGSSLCRVACCSHVVVGQMRSIFCFRVLGRRVPHCCAMEHSDDNTSSSSLYRFLCVFCLTSIYGVIALMLSCRVGQACQNTVALD